MEITALTVACQCRVTRLCFYPSQPEQSSVFAGQSLILVLNQVSSFSRCRSQFPSFSASFLCTGSISWTLSQDQDPSFLLSSHNSGLYVPVYIRILAQVSPFPWCRPLIPSSIVRSLHARVACLWTYHHIIGSFCYYSSRPGFWLSLASISALDQSNLPYPLPCFLLARPAVACQPPHSMGLFCSLVGPSHGTTDTHIWSLSFFVLAFLY